MGSLSAATRQKNDHAPEWLDGKPSERQSEHERYVLFFTVLRGLGIPRQCIRFIYTIKTLTKPGKLYNFNDLVLADHLGCDGSPTTRNYVVNLRRKMREWNETYYDEVLRTKHFSFVSIVENEWDHRTKSQIPTGYIFSEKFAAMLEDLIVKVRNHPRYRDDWLSALRSVCSAAGRDGLQEFGMWNRRKDKQPRSVEDILGTLLLNWKRLTRKIIETSVEFGFDKEDTADYLRKLAPGYINQARDNLFIDGPHIVVGKKGPNEFGGDDLSDAKWLPVRASRNDCKEVWDKVFAYVAAREMPGETILPQKSKSRPGGSNVSDNAQRNITYGGGRDADRELAEYSGMEPGNDIQILQMSEIDEAVDLQKQRFLERVQKRRGPPGKSGKT